MIDRRKGAVRVAAAILALAAHVLLLLALSPRPQAPPTGASPTFSVHLMDLTPPAAPPRRSQPAASEPTPGATAAVTAAALARPATAADAGTDLSADVDLEAAASAAVLAQALRRRSGCAHAEFLDLSPTEREACAARLAAGAANAAYRPPLVDRRRRLELEAAAQERAAYRDYRQASQPPLGIDTTGGGPVMNPLTPP